MFCDFDYDFKKNNVKYAVFIGRFQPFLTKSHYDSCLLPILKHNLMPILFFGSSDSSNNKKVPNFLNNPLNNQERLGQFEVLKSFLPVEFRSKLVFGGFIDDFFDNELWLNNLSNKVNECIVSFDNKDSISNSVFFRVSKNDDHKKDNRFNPPSLSFFDEFLIKKGFKAILSPKLSTEILEISASNYRNLSIYDNNFKKSILASDYIKSLILKNRNDGIFKDFLKNSNIAPTLLDLTLNRFYNECKIDKNLILNSNIKNINDLESFLKELLINITNYD